MANHPNRGWRKTWSIDLQTKTATHQGGFGVVFELASYGWASSRFINRHLVTDDESRRLLQEARELFTKASNAAALANEIRASASTWREVEYQFNVRRVEQLRRKNPHKTSADGIELDARTDAIALYENSRT